MSFETYAVKMFSLFGGTKGLITSGLASFGFMGFMPILNYDEVKEL